VRLLTPLVNTGSSAASSISVIVRHSAAEDLELFDGSEMPLRLNAVPIGTPVRMRAHCNKIPGARPLQPAQVAQVAGTVYGSCSRSLRELLMRRSGLRPAGSDQQSLTSLLASAGLFNAIVGPYGAHRGAIRFTAYPAAASVSVVTISVGVPSSIADPRFLGEVSSFTTPRFAMGNDPAAAPLFDIEVPNLSAMIIDDYLGRNNPAFEVQRLQAAPIVYGLQGLQLYGSVGDDFTTGLIHYLPALTGPTGTRRVALDDFDHLSMSEAP